MKDCLLNYSFEELKNLITTLGEKSFRANQIFKALHLGLDFGEITELSKTFREKLGKNYIAQPITIIKNLKSVDGTEKFLYKLADGNVIEGVLMKYKYGYTLCVSTQVGCRMHCAFCASGLHGLVRNLEAGEILGQVIAVNRYIDGGIGDKRKIINVVLMGSGEPLDNYDNTLKFLRLVSEPNGINISQRNISLSTSGLVPKMIDLANQSVSVNLTVSLHSPFDSEREKIMPIAKAYKIKEILDACSYYFKKTGRRYIFEYVLIKGNNDTIDHANELISLLKGRPCHINLIRLNEVKENDLISVTDKEAYRFLGLLEKGGLSATLRRRMGEDIDGACGQLRQRYLEENDRWKLKGQIYKALTDSYWVNIENKLYKCGAKGLLKYKRNTLSVGDFVEVENGVITKVKERKNSFIRPNVANIDLVVGVISPEPKPDYYLLDKLLINASKENVEVLIVVNKTDIDKGIFESVIKEYGSIVNDILAVSTTTGEGLEVLKQKLSGKLSVLAGQSAVGKTSIVNAMFNKNQKVGELSDKILRGKHTTTRSEIFEQDNIKLIDSPGFAVIDANIELDELPNYYLEYLEYSNECKFRGCKHVNEPDCKIKELVNNGYLSRERYNRYVEIFEEISKRRKIYEKY